MTFSPKYSERKSKSCAVRYDQHHLVYLVDYSALFDTKLYKNAIYQLMVVLRKKRATRTFLVIVVLTVDFGERNSFSLLNWKRGGNSKHLNRQFFFFSFLFNEATEMKMRLISQPHASINIKSTTIRHIFREMSSLSQSSNKNDLLKMGLK